jgi:hypothetical protein
VDTETVIQEILRLRAVQRRTDPSVSAELARTIDVLSGAIGRSVKRSVAARLLGISQTALDRWIANGEIGVVRTPSGRTTVPLEELVSLLEELPSAGESGRPVSAALKRRRENKSLGVDLIPWQAGRAVDGHQRAELRSLAYHRAVARKLDERMLDRARTRLSRWETEGRIDPHWAARWHELLARPTPEIADLIASESGEAADLRQTSPFAGSLTERERREILNAVDKALS